MNRIGLQKKLLLALISVTIAFICTELALRIYSNFYSKQHLPQYKFNQAINDTCKILCLGDSFTYGIGAGFENSYPAQLEEILNKEAQKIRFKVFNLGIPGYNSSEVVIKLIKVIQDIKPQIVIVMTGENDLWNHKNVTWRKLPFGLKIKVLLAKLRCFRLSSVFFENSKVLFSKMSNNTVNSQTTTKNKKNTAKLIEKANIYRTNREYTKAKKFYKQALMKDPSNEILLLELGRCYKLNNEYRKASDVFIDLIRLNPEDKNAHAEIKSLLIKQNNSGKSLELYLNLFKIFPDNNFIRKELFNAYIYSAGIFLVTNQLQRSLNCYEKAIDLYPENKKAILGKEMAQNFLATHDNSRLNEVIFDELAKQNILVSPYLYREIILANNLEKIIETCKRNSSILIFSGYPLGVSNVIKEKTATHTIPLVDHQAAFESSLKQYPLEKYFVSEDDSHCTKAGYRIIATNIASLILNICKQDIQK